MDYEFESSKWYKITYLIPPARIPREMVASYLGWNRGLREYEFNLRPFAGTTALRPEHIQKVEQVAPGSVEKYANRKVRA